MLSKWKRVISAAMSAATVLSLSVSVPSTVWASGVESSTNSKGNLVLTLKDEVNVDFETTPDSSFISSPNIVADPDNSENNVWQIGNSDTDATKFGNVIVGFSAKSLLSSVPTDKSGVLTYEFDLKFPLDNPMENATQGFYYPIYTRFYNYEGPVTGIFRTSNVLPGDGNSANQVNIEDRGKWYTVKQVFDYSTKTFTVYAQGKQVGSSYSFAEAAAAGKDPIDKFWFRGWVPGGFKWYVDNIKVSYAEELGEYSPVSRYFNEDFNDGEYDDTIMYKWASPNVSYADNSTDPTIVPESRGKVLKIDATTAGNGGWVLDVQNKWTQQMARKKGRLKFKFDIYGADCTVNVFDDPNKDYAQKKYMLSNAPGAANNWYTSSVELDYDNNTITRYYGGKSETTSVELTDDFKTDYVWKPYFRQWQSLIYLDNIEISYLEELPEIASVSGSSDTAAGTVAAEAVFDAYDEKDAEGNDINYAFVAIYEADSAEGAGRLIGVNICPVGELTDKKLTCTLSGYTVDSAKIYTAKAMLWNLSSAKPLCATKASAITTAE